MKQTLEGFLTCPFPGSTPNFILRVLYFFLKSV